MNDQAKSSVYTIRNAEGPGALCTACGKQETGSGPVGFLDDDPICDVCFLESSPELGMTIALISVVRAYANMEGNPAEWLEALKELSAFARIYDRFAAKSGPARIPKFFPDSSDHDVLP